MKVADYIINHLGDLGIKDIFVVYGAANGDLVDAFVRTDKTRYVCTMHEQGGGFAAEGYAKTTGNIGVAMATSGPGGQNFVTPIGNCFYDSVPCLFITGQINSRFLRPDDSIRQVGFQETDIISIVKPITKYAKMVTDAKDIRYELEKAIHIAKSGRPGPVLLDLPLNMQKEDIGDPKSLIGYSNISIKQDPFQIYNGVNKFLQDLSQSKRPTIVVGGGIKHAKAEAEVRHLGSLLKIPVFPTWNAVDVIASDYPMYGGKIGTYGGAGRNFGIQNSDLILCIGSRLSGRITGGNVSSFGRGAKRYTVDVDEAALQPKLQQLPFHENIYCDAKHFCIALVHRLVSDREYHKGDMTNDRWSNWTERVMGWKKKYDFVTPDMFESSDIVHPYAFMRILSEEMNDNDVILGDCGGNIVAMNHAFDYKVGQIHITNNGNSPMGFSFAAGIGACLAHGNKGNTVAVIGDGGFNMNIQELQTLVNYKIPLKTIILNNHIYGITKAYQEVNFEGRSEACGPKGYSPPDFVKIVHAYGIRTLSILDGNDYVVIRENIRTFLQIDGPVVMDVNCHEHHTYQPKLIGWNTPIEDMYPYLDDDEFYDNMIIEPLERERFGDKHDGN